MKNAIASAVAAAAVSVAAASVCAASASAAPAARPPASSPPAAASPSAREAALVRRLPEIFAKCAARYRAIDAEASKMSKGATVPHGWRQSDGRLDMRPVRGWTAGHYPGSMWLLYEATGDAFFKERAGAWTALLAPNSKETGNHDVGFIMYCSFGNARRLLGTDKYDALLIETAHSLAKRYNPRLGLIRSWGDVRDRKHFLVIPDNLMNLELLEWASKNGGGGRFDEIARSHAAKTMRHHFRPDGGAFHVLDYDQSTLRVQEIRRGQGASCETAWSRGQSWAIYGYTMMYRETRDPAFLAFARKVADFAIRHPAMPGDGVPCWDYGAPGEERDSSAAAVMASALLELSTFVPGAAGAEYRAFAVKQLESLSSAAYSAAPGANGGWILMHGVGHKPGGSEIDVPLCYGDYYYLEALLRLRRLATPAPAAARPAPCPDSLYLEYSRNGNRSRYEKAYLGNLAALEKAILRFRRGGGTEAAAEIAEYLDFLSGLKSWTLPAHDAALTSFKGRPHVDLVAARAGFIFADALSAAGASLPAATVRRARAELERRVFKPYLATARKPKGAPGAGHWWFRSGNNWNAVCHSLVLRAALLHYPPGAPERACIVRAAADAVPYYLDGFSPDGYCSEGAGYWNYGFGNFLLMGLALKDAPEKIDVFAAHPKARTAAAYGFGYKMSPRVSPRFADGEGTPAAKYRDICRRIWPDLETGLGPRSAFPSAQAWIFRPAGRQAAGGVSLGLKGGHNAELHNHNDVGSYNIAVRDSIVTGDPGGEVYTRRTFSKNRYASKVLSSYAHPVPRVDGRLQGTGRRFAAKVLKTEFSDEKEVVVLDIAGAYECDRLVSLVRTFEYDRASGAVAVIDKVRFSAPSRFEDPVVTLGRFEDGAVFGAKSGGAGLGFSASVTGGAWTWREETVENPGRASVSIRSVALDSVTEAEVVFRFAPRGSGPAGRGGGCGKIADLVESKPSKGK